MPRGQGKQPSDWEREGAKTSCSSLLENEAGTRTWNEVGTRRMGLWEPIKAKSQENREFEGLACY